jgi:putative nucleotidyltransferase with HDIG domain
MLKLDSTFLRSKVARRIFLQFTLCALFPFAVLAILSIREVTKQLKDQSEARLSQATRVEGMSIFERLGFLQAEMQVIATELERGADGPVPAGDTMFPAEMREHFTGVEQTDSSRVPRSLFGHPLKAPDLAPAELRWVASGHTAISVDADSGHSRIFMSLLLDSQRKERGMLVAELNTDYLWGADIRPAQTDMCILDSSNRLLFCSGQNLLPFLPQDEKKKPITEIASDWFPSRKDQAYVVQQWEIFLKPQFAASQWTLVLGEPRAETQALLSHFKKTFPLVILLSVWLVSLLSLIQIRRSLIPLERLKEGTERIARLDFETPVKVNSGDEFQDLANSFNHMAGRLGRQLGALETINQIDRAILSSLDTEKIVSTVLNRMRQILPFDCVSISLLDPHAPGQLRTYLRSQAHDVESEPESCSITSEELQQLHHYSEVVLLDSRHTLPAYLHRANRRGMKSFFLLPLVIQGKALGVISLGHSFLPALSDEDIFHTRQIADQVAVALSNAGLVQELEDLHLGTLTALARAIDAKSAWTSGHSERVTQLAMRIGRVCGLSPRDLETLHRGGMLHDIGKIGVPAGILDKPGKLTTEEFQLMREHVRIGARILEPIPGFEQIIPIVLQHHEWFDGSGYPDGLAGENINLLARIFALADCYDALTSDRPYRRALDHERVMEMIETETGTHFDPKVVRALPRALEQESDEFPAEGSKGTVVNVSLPASLCG